MGFIGFMLLMTIAILLFSGTRRRPQVGPPRQHMQLGFSPYQQQGFGQNPWAPAWQPQQQWSPPVDLSTAVKATDEDITSFGDELRDLDLDVMGLTLDTATRQDYQRALDAYEDAKQSLSQVQRPDDIKHTTSILEDGRYAIASVKARIAGEPLPVKRPPCFFNPAHGPSTQNVTWAPPGGSPREIPACAADAERVLAGADPYVRTVVMGPARVPYWQDPAYAPYAQGYYSNWQTDQVVRSLAVGTAVFAGLAILPHVLEGLDDVFDGFDF